MIYIKVDAAGKAIGVAENGKEGAISRWDYTSREHVVQLAAELSEATGKVYISIETGASPKWDVIEAPKVGDEVSYGFNGDYYPCGTIVSISKTMKKITDSEGHSFYRKGNSGSWILNKMWTMVKGHHTDRNPHF